MILRALGYLGAAPIYHTDLRLSKDVTETIFTDAWDERVDAVSRGLLGLTVVARAVTTTSSIRF